MLKKHNLFSIFFALIFIIHLLAIANDLPRLVGISKPLIATSLLIYFYNISKLSNPFQKRIFAGLIFSLIGDELLTMVEINPNFFMAGLIAFLLAQLSYISAFYLDFSSNS